MTKGQHSDNSPSLKQSIAKAPGPLFGLRVLDLSRVMAGNMLTLQFADFGADVIKIESPGEGDPLRQWCTEGVPVWWRVYSRNKRSLALNLRDAEGMKIFRGLVKTADVLVENFRPGTLEKMGLDPISLHGLNEKLVIARISGWGQTGPFRHKPGFGSLVEAYSGLAAKTGFEDRPPVLPNMALADMMTGLYGFGSVLTALRVAQKQGGRGQVIDISLFDSMLSCLGPDAADFAILGTRPLRNGSRSPTAAPRNVYKTLDNEWVALSATTQAMTERLLNAINRPEMIVDRKFVDNKSRLDNVEEIDGAIQAFIGQHNREDVLRHFEKTEVTVGPVMDAGQLLEDSFVRERGSLVAAPDPDRETLPMHDVVPRLSETPGSIRRIAPKLGEDTRDVLQELGFGDGDIEVLLSKGTIQCAI